MSTRSLTAAALVVTAILASTCSSEPTPPELAATVPVDAAPWILFQQDAGSRYEVALVRADGTDRVAPLHDLGTGNQTNPDWSPDGQQLVFAMSDGERDDLWVADADGGHARLLLDCARLCLWLDDPDWSPDGRSIVYSQTKRRQSGNGTATLETVDVVTGRVRVLLGPWRRDARAGARYSPDGSQIVFERVHKIGLGPDADLDGVTLSIVRLDEPGHPVRALTDPRLYAATADWSPDGERIVYSALAEPGDEAPDLFWIGPTGGEPTRITSLAGAGGFAAEPAWLTDGSGLLFSGHLAAGSGSPELLTVAVDGSGVGSAVGEDTLLGRHPRAQPTS
jgi:Tol biopolymer transport system component